jgi:hypothetical protein
VPFDVSLYHFALAAPLPGHVAIKHLVTDGTVTINAHHDERCLLPIHVLDADSSHCVAVVLRPGKTPSGKEIRTHHRRLIRRIRRHWPQTPDHHPRRSSLAKAEFATIRLRLLKLAARINETATRVRIAFATVSPQAALFRGC